MNKIGFDSEKYLSMQSERIEERIADFDGKLYLEFGGKLFDDYHASRALPGFEPDSKLKMLLQMKEQAEIIIAINSNDIEIAKVRGDLGITYEQEVLRLIDIFRSYGLYVGSVVLNRYVDKPSIAAFEKYLATLGIKTYRHYSIEGYPSNIDMILSEDGFGKNDYIETSRSLIVVTAPGPGSGKMATCLSQVYNEYQRGNLAGYAKFETFPIWNIPLKHPVNLAYEAATADLNDVNMIDPFHLSAYGTVAVNYNRDVEVFPVLNAIFTRIYGECRYQSPTDMGVNMVGNCIYDDEAVSAASREEIIRRYYTTLVQKAKGKEVEAALYKLKMLMNQADIRETDRVVVGRALEVEEQTNAPAAALELPDGTVVTGKTTPLLGACAAVMMNALKALADLPDIHLLAPEVIHPIQDLKVKHLGNRNPRIHTDEMLLALSVCAVHDENAKKAIEQLGKLKGCEMHTSVILSEADERVLKKLQINLTSEPKREGSRLYSK
ncbi:MAG: DUF1846 domain-containing protein [Lachnospiraceae bacterium]|nr:DUF1846 domain-containing protein [Lachnospiraceae bacterium]